MNIFELYGDRIKWSNDKEAAKIILSYPIFFPWRKFFSFISKKKKIGEIFIPDEILRLLFDKNSLSIIKDKHEGKNRIIVTFYFSTPKNKIHLIFHENESEMVVCNNNKNEIHQLDFPISCVQGRLIFLLPFDAVMEHCRYYKIRYDLRHKKIILNDQYNKFEFTKSMFPKMFPL